MAWATSRPTGVVIEKSRYWEYRPDPDDEDELEARRRERTVTEFRGMTLATADNLIANIVSGGSEFESLTAIGGGGYNITKVEDKSVSAWQKMPGGSGN